MKKFTTKTITFILLIICAITASRVYAGFSSSAPAGNTETPLNISLSNQYKTGDISVNIFSVGQSAQFEQGVTVLGSILGTPSTPHGSTIKIGGTYPGDIARVVNMKVVNGNIKVSYPITSTALANTNTSDPICADSTGTLISCD